MRVATQTNQAHGQLGAGGDQIYQRARQALADAFMRRATKLTTDRLRLGKEKAYAEIADLEALRERARAIRAHTIANLDYYLAQLAERVRQNGGHIYFAATAEEATAYVLDVVRRAGARLVAKSKSMISEELHLNDRLEAEGVEVVETDLGEYIVQLAKEVPSHIIIPALHKSRQDVAELFSRASGQELPSDTGVLTAFARERLREVFLRADVGITGCNFAVAETGTICLVTNEGNGRMVTSLPRVHIALMGMERVVTTLGDLDIMLHLLPRSATGQKVTVYVNLCSGPRREGELDGPEEFHLVVVDNGRSHLLGGDYQEALHCIRCGACMNVCPVYRQIGGHAYGWVYPGPIGAVVVPLYRGVPEWGDLAQASSLCGACTETCPVKIPLHDLLIGLRRDKRAQTGGNRWENLAFRAWRFVLERPRLYGLALKAGRLLQAPLARQGVIRQAPLIGRAWTATRDLRGLAPQSFRERWVATGGRLGEGPGTPPGRTSGERH